MDILYNWLSLILNVFVRFFNMCKTFFQSIIDFFSATGSIIKTLFFGLKSLLSGIGSLINEIFDGSLFQYLLDGFNNLSYFVGFTGATFITSILFVVIVRILIGFVFKMFRLNVDYKTMKTKWK